MVIDIVYFDNFVDEDYLVKITKCKVLSKTPCFSKDIRLRKYRKSIITYHLDDYWSNITDYSYGMLYKLEIDDLDVFKLYHPINSYIKEIELSTIIVDNVENFMKNIFKIKEHGVKAMCFVSKVDEINTIRYKKRKNRINFNKRLLLNFLKI